LVASEQNYKFSENISLNKSAIDSETHLISSHNKISFLFCLSECNLYPDCLSVVFSKININNKNCFIFRKFFDESDKIKSASSNLYEKKSNIFLCINVFKSFSYEISSLVSNYNELCYATHQCNTTKFLICNDENTLCNCPINVGIKKCDCLRVNGKEYYWNETAAECVPALNYNEECSESYMCKRFENTICDSSSNTCDCIDSNYYNYDNEICENRLGFRSYCSQIDACRLDLGKIFLFFRYFI
jgi:hypothetical protein